MAGDWREVTLEESMTAIIDYRGKTPRKVSTGIPLITAKLVKDGRIETPEEFIAEEDYVDWMRRGLPQRGDVVVTTEAPLGEVAQLTGERVALAQRLICLRGKPGLLDNDFLKFLMQSDGVQAQLHSRSSGTTVLGIKQSELRKIVLTLPSLSEQRAIAHVLGVLDHKIESNKRMSETLEAISRALFKSWFVDFDPVRAKMEGRDAGLPKLLADLFPDRLADTEVGEIPEAWEVGTLENAVFLQRGFDLPADRRNSGPYPVLAASGPNGTHDQCMVRGPGVTTGRSGVLGKVFYVFGDFWPLNTSLWVREFRRAKPAYALHLLRGLNLAQFNAGSAVPTLNRNHIHSLPTLLPPEPLVEAFDEFATHCLQRQGALDKECLALGALRDGLLPKLISGELRMRHVGRFANGG